jgi:hypothetical protein
MYQMTPLHVEAYHDRHNRALYETRVGRDGRPHQLGFEALMNLIRYRQGGIKLLEYRR